MPDAPVIRSIADADVGAVLALWSAVVPDPRPWNQPAAYLSRKRALGDGLLLVAERAGAVVGAVALGWDGVRGWIYHLAVDPAARRLGVGSALMRAAEAQLQARGCPKINLQIMPHNQDVVRFYARLGYVEEARISMGKALA
jgi:ribosomal protein S18 acetylase RimI-like enzyme